MCIIASPPCQGAGRLKCSLYVDVMLVPLLAFGEAPLLVDGATSFVRPRSLPPPPLPPAVREEWQPVLVATPPLQPPSPRGVGPREE